jgi:glycosyltransferase involved in cell wall biosynthesis
VPQQQPVYLAVCAIYRDEAPYMREWLEFHMLEGVERFFLYDNDSSDNHDEILAPYIEQGRVVLHRWPHHPGQVDAYNHCLEHHGSEARWIAFIDLDEYLFSPPPGKTLPDALAAYERWPGVGVHWAVYGPSGHDVRPDGLIIENYLYRTTHPNGNRWIKSIVDPKRVIRCVTPHAFRYVDGLAVDEEERPITGPVKGRSLPVCFSKLRINHYWTKSRQEWQVKVARGWASREGGRPTPWSDDETLFTALTQQYDDVLVDRANALRRAMSGRD